MVSKPTTKKVRVAIMNAIHDLPVLVARDEGLFADEGLDLEVISTPGTAQATSDHSAMREVIFDRTMESLYNDGDVNQYRMCEWGVMKRTVEAEQCGQRPSKIVALGAAMTSIAVFAAPDSNICEPEQLKNKPIAVSPYNGSHFTTLKMMEGFLRREYIKTTFTGTMRQRLEALGKGEVAAASFFEPWISIAQKRGFRILIESHSSRSEAASEDLDGPTLAAMFRAQGHASDMINHNPAPYVHYLVEESGGLLEAKDLQSWRLLHAHPRVYTAERFEDTYNWMVDWGLTTPGATYESAVDSRAWQ